MRIELTTTPTPEDALTISQGIIDYNRQTCPDLEPNSAEIPFSVFAHNDQEQVVGGIRATCYWNILHLELLWLVESTRGSGIGREMVNQAEDFARQRGFEQCLVTTTSWQAKPFYEKCGYTLMATLPHYPIIPKIMRLTF